MLILGIVIGIGFTVIMGLCAAASDTDRWIEARNKEDRDRNRREAVSK